VPESTNIATLAKRLWTAICARPLHWKKIEHFSLDGVDYEAFNTSGGAWHFMRKPGR